MIHKSHKFSKHQCHKKLDFKGIFLTRKSEFFTPRFLFLLYQKF